MTTQPTPLDDFWSASSVSSADAAAFGARIAAFEAIDEGIHPFVGPCAPIPLRPVDDRTQRLFDARRSTRQFSASALRHRDLERILGAVGPTSDGRRTIAEAGGFDAVFTYAIGRNVDGPAAGRIVRYDHRSHAIADVGPAPDDETLRRWYFVEPDADLPHMIVIFVLDVAMLLRKYGQRGGRFALQQVGHATQNVALRLAADGLAGYELGGGHDREILAALGVANTRAWYGASIACGRAPRSHRALSIMSRR